MLTVDKNGGKYTQLSDNAIRADVAYTGTGVPEGILQSVTSTVARNGVVTHSGDSLQKVTAGSYAGVSNSGGTEVAGSWNYIINDSSWENSGAEYKDGYVDLVDLKGDKMPRGFKTTDSGLNWDEVKQTYTYKGKAVDYRNMYVIDGKLGVFTNADGSEVYTGTVYGKHNEILMTVKDNGKFYSYWAASVTDPSVTMETYPVSKYNSDLAVIDKNIKDLNKDIIKEVTLTKGDDSAIIRLVRNGGNAVDGAITVTSGGGTGGSDAAHDTFVKISNGTTEQTFATGSKVEAIGSKDATTGIKINGEDYTIKSGSKVSVAQNDKTTTITVDGKATVITDTDTKYTKGNGIAIDKANAISVKLNKEEKNLVVDGSGLALNTALTGIQSITGAGEGKISFEGATVKVNQNTFNKDGRIQNVAKGTENTDAVNFGQLKETVAAGDTDVHIKAGNYTVDKDNKVSMNLVDKAGKSQGTVTITGVAKAEDVAVVYDKNKTSLRSTNATLQTSSGKEEAVDSIALGNGASAVKGSVAIGNGASVVEGSNGLGGVALGYKAHAGYKGTSLGSNAISGREGTTLVGANTNSGSLYTTVVGTDSVINSDGTEYNAIITSINVQGATATVVGSKNTVDNNNGLVYSGVANNVMGSANTIEGSNGVTIQGTGNKVTDAYKDMGITLGEAYSIYKGNYSALAKKQSGAIAVVGGANTVSKQTDSTVIGYDNRLIGGEENISHDVFMAGSHNTLNNVSDSIVMGNENAITGVSNVISFGHQNTISANNAVAIGNGAGVSVEGGVALGVGSVASTVAGALGYGAAEGETSIAWNATHGAVSVGSSVEGKEITRQITNVAAGTEDTDAVNVAQLKKVSEAAASASQGWKLKTQNGNASDVKPGATVEFDGDANIQVGNDGNKVSVTLKKQLTGIQSITGEGAGSISFANGGKVKVNDVIIEKGGKITGVAAGEVSSTSTDAINGSQLHAVKETANKGWNLSTNGDEASTKVAPGETVDFSGDKNISVSHDGTNVKVELNDELKDIKSISNGNKTISLDGTALLLKNGDATLAIAKGAAGMQNGAGASVVLNGTQTVINGGVTFDHTGKITNVKAGEADTDAVNVSQLNAVKETANKGWNLSTNGDEASTKVAPGETVDFSGDKNISVSHDGTNVKVELNDELKDIKSISNGNKTISLDGTALLLKNGDATLAIAKGAAGMQNGAGASVVLNGTQTVINGGVTFDHTGKITNVKAGEADTDAVNVGQLKDYVAANDTHIKSGDYVVGEVTDSTGNKSQGVSMDIVNKEGNVTGTVTITDVAKASDVGNVNDIADDLKNGGEGKTTVVEAVNNLNNKLDTKVGDLQYSKVEKGDIADGDSTTTAIGKLDQKLTDVAATAAKHTKVEGSKNITVNNTAKEGEAANYKVELNNDIDVNTVKANSVTTGQTVMDKDGLKVGDKVSVTATAVKVGDTTITDKGLEIKDGPSVTKDGINAGNKKVTGVADGDVKENSKDAINGGQLHQAKADINNRIDGVENQVISNSNRINQLGNRVNKVGAGAAALAALHPMDFDPDDKLTFSAGYGNYGGENAAAIGAYYRPDEKVMFSVGGTVGNGENMVNAGISFALDRTNHVSNSRTALAREVIDLRGQLAVMGAKMAKMEKALGMLDETKTKLFPDIPANHWAYEYIAKLAGNGYIEGYPDGNFGGDRLMTRYEFAAMLYRAIENGAALEEKIIKEFEPELGRIRVDRISGEDGDRDKIERVRVNDTKGERDHYGNKLAK